MKTLLKFSVQSSVLNNHQTLIKLIPSGSKDSTVNEADETLEIFAEDIEQIGFVLNNGNKIQNRNEVVTLEFNKKELKFMYIKGHKFEIIRTSDPGLYFLRSLPKIKGIDTLPELFQHRIKYLTEFGGEEFLKWHLQREIDGCELAAAVFKNLFGSTRLVTEKDFAEVGKLIRPEGYQFIGGCPINFALSMCLALQTCPTGILLDNGQLLVDTLALWPVMYLPICGDLDGELYQPNKADIISYLKTQLY